ncbi:hypothetical protein SAMN05444405_10183 [Bacteroides luti]|uniref:Uncharacterized protein n=1 Tax=Bacteroides luti TaxID=1297750 RepID=A0A1M4SEZ6_9BACE|nr:hypothetical protein SAMN05444405_10183 [Bacteroides luti]
MYIIFIFSLFIYLCTPLEKFKFQENSINLLTFKITLTG